MSYRSTRDVVQDLIRHGRCVVVDEPVSPNLEMAEIQRRVYARGGPAVLFTQPVETGFPMVCNLFGSLDQARFLFRDTIEQVRRAIELKVAPQALLRNPLRYRSAPIVGLRMRPKVVPRGAVEKNTSSISRLPQLICWPGDGGAFVTLPQVLSQPPGAKGLSDVNLGMYRIQLSGNEYAADREVGLHYQLHRGIGVHHTAAAASRERLPVTITVGGTPAMTLAAVMPLPEGMSELTFAGALAGHRIPMLTGPHSPIYADADFAIVGSIDPARTLPEGPFGDHLGYYARVHEFPVMTVEKVYHRDGAIWPFTVVGRPPQEDTTFGELIHDLTGPVLPTVLPGVKGVHAVDAAGVHPLLLAIGSERYEPYRKADRPAELLTQACAILGQGQLSLAKYLLIVNGADDPALRVDDTQAFFQHILARIDWRRDLHFITRTTIDTLDYSGEGLNEGSKVIVAARGEPRRRLTDRLGPGLIGDSSLWSDVRLAAPGIAVASPLEKRRSLRAIADDLTARFTSSADRGIWDSTPLIVLADDAAFATATWNNFLWTAFTRSNPAADIDGVDAFCDAKHWGCHGPLIVDARAKPHHADPLIEPPEIKAKVDAMAARGGPLARYL